MKDKVIKRLIKNGFTEASVQAMVSSQFDYAVKIYPEATPAKVANIVSTLWSLS